MAIRKDIAIAVFGQTGSLVREKLTMKRRKRRPPKSASDEGVDGKPESSKRSGVAADDDEDADLSD